MPRNTHSEAIHPLRVSQNYLTSARTIHQLLNITTLHTADHVVEIGPGKGHITAALISRCGHVTAVELDGRLYENLKARFAGAENLRLIRGDFLDWPLPRSGSYKVFSNIPFNRTTEIVRKLTECANPPEEAWLVTEKGAAKRFAGKPRETLRSLLIKPWFDIDVVWHFRREDFHPLPGVDAVLLHLKRKAAPDVPAARRASFAAFVEGGMRQGLAGLRRLAPKARLAQAMREAGVARETAPGDVLYVQWLCLYRCGREQA